MSNPNQILQTENIDPELDATGELTLADAEGINGTPTAIAAGHTRLSHENVDNLFTHREPTTADTTRYDLSRVVPVDSAGNPRRIPEVVLSHEAGLNYDQIVVADRKDRNSTMTKWGLGFATVALAGVVWGVATAGNNYDRTPAATSTAEPDKPVPPNYNLNIPKTAPVPTSEAAPTTRPTVAAKTAAAETTTITREAPAPADQAPQSPNVTAQNQEATTGTDGTGTEGEVADTETGDRTGNGTGTDTESGNNTDTGSNNDTGTGNSNEIGGGTDSETGNGAIEPGQGEDTGTETEGESDDPVQKPGTEAGTAGTDSQQ